MAFSLKKWVTGMLESTRLNDTNTNWTDIESAIDTLQTNASLLPIHKLLQNESILGYAETLSPGAYFVWTTEDTIDLPSANYRHMPGLILVRTTTGIVVVLFNRTNGQIATNGKTTSGWLSNWKIIG
jgi:hypothetical protein